MLGLGLGLDKPRGLIYFQNQYSMYFDGVTSRIITDDADTVAQPTTYSFWCKSSEAGVNKGVFGHGDANIGAFHFNFSSDKPLLYLGSGDFINWDISGDQQDDGKWHHWVVYSDTNDITNSKLYVDGVLQTPDSVASAGNISAYTESLTIGSERQVGGNSFLGNIDEFAVFDRELTQAEITRMYNTYYTNNLIQNSGFDEIGDEEVTNRDFSQIGNEEVDNGSFSEIGNEEVTGFTNGTTYPFTTFTTSGNNITSAIVSSAFAGAVSNAISVTSGKIYKVTFDYTKNSGDDLRVVFSSVVSGAGAQISNSELISASGSYTKYFTITSTTTGYLQMGTGNSGHSLNASITNVSVKEVGQGWTADSNWTIDQANNKAISDGSQSGNVSLRQSNSIMGLTTGSFYKVEFTISNYSEGQINPHVRGNASGNVSGDGVKTSYIAAGSGSDGINLYSNLDFEGDISNISVKEVGQHWTVTGSDSTHYVEFLSTGARFVSDTVSPVLELKQNAITPGKQYVLTCNVAYTGAGQLRVNVGSNLTAFTEGANTRYFTATSNTMSFLRENANVDALLSNLSVKEVGQNWEVANPDADNYIVFNGSTARLKFLNTSPLTQLIAQGFTLTSGKTYKLTVDVASVTSGSIKIDAVGMSELFNTAGVTTRILQPTGNSDLTFYRATADVDITLNSVTLQQLKHSATNLLVNSGDYQSASPLLTSTKSMNFDGIDDYLQVGDVGSVKSMSFWFNPDNNITASSSEKKLFGFNTTYYGIALGSLTGALTGETLTVIPDNSNKTATTKEFDAGRWYNIVIAWNETASYFDIYVDGVLSTDLNTGSAHTLTNWSNFKIGTDNNLASEFNGQITETGVWDRTLTALEVASLYNQGVPTDLLVNRNNYQSGNPTVFNTKQVDFDGTDDYLKANSTLGSFTGSISAWVKRDTVNNWSYVVDFRTNSGGGYLNISPTGFIDTGGISTKYVDNVATSQVPQDTEWHHIVITNLSINITECILIGARYSLTEQLNGKISQVGLWNTTLTADEVSSLYNHGLPIDLNTDQAAYASSSDLVGYWRMGSGTNDGFPIIQDQLSPSLAHISTTNLIPYSEDFENAAWSTSELSFGSKVTSPIGTNDAITIIETDATAQHNIYDEIVGFTNEAYTLSCYAKLGTSSNRGIFLRVRDGNTSGTSYGIAWYNLSDGTFTMSGGISANIENVNNGWYRCSLTVTAPSGNSLCLIGLANGNSNYYDGDGTSNVLIWGSQLEKHPIATPYVKSNGIAGQRKPSTTNLIKYSEDFTQSFWTPTRCTITSNQITSPNGTLDADLLTATDTSENYIQTSNTVAVSGTSQTVSFYVKKGTSDFAHILLWDNSSNGARQWFDLTNGTIGTSTSFGSGITVNNANIISYSDNWYRCIVVFSNSTANIKTRVSASNSNGSITSTVGKTIYIWGAQLEVQTQATPYIKTVGSPVTVEFYKENNYAEMVNLGGGADFSDGIKNGSPYANIVHNSDFGSSTGWSDYGTVSFGTNQVTIGASSNSGIYQSLLTQGKTYIITADIIANNGVGEFEISKNNGVVIATYTTTGLKTITYTHDIADPIILWRARSNNISTLNSVTVEEVNTGLQGYWKMGDGTNDEYPVIYDQTNPTLSAELITNGNFATEDDWQFNGPDFSAGAITFNASSDYIFQSFGDTVGKTYKIVITKTGDATPRYRTGYAGSDATINNFPTSNIVYFTATSNTNRIQIYGTSGGDFVLNSVSVKEVQGNPAFMTHMPEGNITNQYPLTKIRNYYRMGDGTLDSKFTSYPATAAPFIFQDQTSPNLAHIPTTNLVTYSEDFTGSFWNRYGGIDTSSLVLAPDGTVSAQKLVRTSGIYNIIRPAVNITGTYYAQSVFVKNIDADNFYLRLEKSGAAEFGYYNFASDTISDTDIKVEHLANDWIRLSTNVPDNDFKSFGIGENELDNTELNHAVYVWGAQIEAQGQATPYLKSSGVNAVRKSSTTNLIEYSEDFTQSDWTKTNVDVSNNTELAPNNTLTATRTIINATGTDLRTQCNVIASSNYTWSFYAKKGTSTDITYRVYDVSNGSNIVSPTNYYSQLSTNWERVTLNFTTPSGCTSVFVYLTSDSVEIGDIYLWGAQLEEQTQAETYAPTKGIPVTIDLFTENNYGHTQGGEIIKDVPRNS